MGIESVSGVTGAASFQNSTAASQATPAKATTKPVTEAAPVGGDAVTESARPSALNTAVAGAENASTQANPEGNEAAKQSETTMKDVNSISKLINNNTVAEFSYNEPTNRIAIKIKDKETDEVIREIPSEKALEMLAKAWELAGIMVDEKR